VTVAGLRDRAFKSFDAPAEGRRASGGLAGPGDATRRDDEMENQEWQEVVGALVDAKRRLASAWQILDGTDGAASGVEHALDAALASIDARYAIEHVNAYKRTSRPSRCARVLDEAWRAPGFAAGT
jgi:hypothetical protein